MKSVPVNKTKSMIHCAIVLSLFSCLTVCTYSLAAEDLTTAIIRVAKDVTPAVVHIEITERRQMANPLLPFQNDPFFRRFFNQPGTQRKFKQEVRGVGTGMLIDAQGHILTNYHVAGNATKIEVQLTSGQRYSATLVGGDPKTDLAVIRINAKEKLPYVKFGDSDKVQVGQWIVAIGTPRGLDKTVTQGIVSATHRTGITDPSSYQDFLQTDAAINPGNSGGPLLNLQSEVVGVNSVIASSSGGFEGIGFAIPSNIAVYVSKTLIAKGKVERGWLGVTVEDLTYERANSLGLATAKGAYIQEVTKNGPAAKAGLKTGDVITAFNGKEVNDGSELRNQVAVTAIGSIAKVTIFRDRKPYTFNVNIGNSEDATKALVTSLEQKLGAGFRPPTAAEQDKYGLDPDQGVVLTRVNAKGPLGSAGFEINDVILEVNEQPVDSLETFAQLIGALQPNKQAAFLAIDHKTGNSGYVSVTIR